MNILKTLGLLRPKPKKEASQKPSSEPVLTKKQRALKSLYKDEDTFLFI